MPIEAAQSHISTKAKAGLMRALLNNKLQAGAFLLALQLGLPAATWAKDVVPMTQGLHTWPVTSGKLMAIVSTYQDTTTFRRNYSFYFKANGREEWDQVPVIRKREDVDFSPASAGAGDDTTADGIVVAQGASIYWVYAEQREARGATIVTWFQLVEPDDAHPDDPAHAFRPVVTRSYARNGKQTLAALLVKESSLKPAK